MKKFLPIILSIFALIINNEAFGMQAPQGPRKARRVSQQPMMGQPGRQQMGPQQMTGAAQPPAEIQNLLKQNAEAIEKLLKQVEDGQLEPAKATVQEIKSIRTKLDAFMKQQAPQAPTTQTKKPVPSSANKQVK